MCVQKFSVWCWQNHVYHRFLRVKFIKFHVNVGGRSSEVDILRLRCHCSCFWMISLKFLESSAIFVFFDYFCWFMTGEFAMCAMTTFCDEFLIPANTSRVTFIVFNREITFGFLISSNFFTFRIKSTRRRFFAHKIDFRRVFEIWGDVRGGFELRG